MFRRRNNKLTKKPKRAKKLSFRPETIMLIKQICIGLVSVTLVVLVIWGVWHGTRLPAVTMSEIDVKGGYTISHDEVRAKVLETMQGEYLKLIPKTFSLFYPKQEILKNLKEIDKLKDPAVQRHSLSSLYIEIDEHIPHALWCEEREGGKCYFVDEYGFAFSRAPQLTGSAYLRYRTLGRTPELLGELTDNEQLIMIAGLARAFEDNFGFPVIAVELDVVGDVFYILRGGSEIKVSKRLTVENTIRNLEAVLSAPEFKDLEPGDFPYIDLRFGNKVFVSDEWPVEEIIEEEIEIIEINIAEAVEVPTPIAPSLSSESVVVDQPEEEIEEEMSGMDSQLNEVEADESEEL